ncbi:MAG: hypothetical protein OEM15_19110 [Myxococcales bacterium]|nr:hypothetical protein [Myxococcales bacterium]
MKLTKQIDVDAVRRLYRADIPAPVDVLNLIRFKDDEAYRWYGVLVMPLLKTVGARVGWFGGHTISFAGEPQADELGVVRYPNQRRFFALALNPYYVLVANPQRLKAVRAFQASFTHSSDTLDALSSSKWVLVVHHHPGRGVIGALQKSIEQTGGRLVYQSAETSPIVIAKKHHPANTNPLVYKNTALFRYESQERCEDAITPGILNQLKEATGDDVSVQLYRRLTRREMLPSAFAKLIN